MVDLHPFIPPFVSHSYHLEQHSHFWEVNVSKLTARQLLIHLVAYGY